MKASKFYGYTQKYILKSLPIFVFLHVKNNYFWSGSKNTLNLNFFHLYYFLRYIFLNDMSIQDFGDHDSSKLPFLYYLWIALSLWKWFTVIFFRIMNSEFPSPCLIIHQSYRSLSTLLFNPLMGIKYGFMPLWRAITRKLTQRYGPEFELGPQIPNFTMIT